MAIIKGARNLEAARKFVDWALSPEGQKIGLDVKEYAIPTNRNVPLPPQVPPLTSTSRSSTTTSRNTARPPSASACSSAGRRKSTRRRDDVARAGYARIGWLAVGAVGFLAVPWYALQDSVLGVAWLRDYSAKDNAPALVQAFATGARGCSPLGDAARSRLRVHGARSSRATLRARAMIAIGALGFVYLLAQGFAIGPRGLSYEWLAASLGPLATGAVRHGARARRSRPAAFAMLFALGIAERGAFKGDAFVACSVVAVSVLGGDLHVFPGGDDPRPGAAGRRRRAVAATRSPTGCSPRRSGALGCLVRRRALRRRVEYADPRAAVRRRLRRRSASRSR